MPAKMIGGASFLPEILGQTDRVGAKSPIFDLFSLVYSAWAVTQTHSKNVQLTRSPLRDFQWAQDEYHKKGGLKTQSVQNLNNKLR